MSENLLNNLNHAKKYFLLGNSYFETAKLGIRVIVDSGNKNYIISSKPIDESDLANIVIKSDTYLFRPSLFNLLQGIELYLKGVLILYGKFNNSFKSHKLESLFKELEKYLDKDSELILLIKNFINSPIDILKNYKEKNDMNEITQIYESLRYPETRNNIEYFYDEIIYKGVESIEQLKALLLFLENIQKSCVTIYRKKETELNR